MGSYQTDTVPMYQFCKITFKKKSQKQTRNSYEENTDFLHLGQHKPFVLKYHESETGVRSLLGCALRLLQYLVM